MTTVFLQNQADSAYAGLINEVLSEGRIKADRTGTGTISYHGYTVRYSCKEGFPILTTKQVLYRSAIAEMICFMRGYTNVKQFNLMGTKVWDKFADPDTGSIGDLYGRQWVNWICSGEQGRSINQLNDRLTELKNNPFSRRLLISAWNPQFLPPEDTDPTDNPKNGLFSLAPCHHAFQLIAKPGQKNDIGKNNSPYLKRATDEHGHFKVLDLHLSIRSNDLFLGHPFNCVGYSFLLMWISACYGFVPGELIISIADAHIYKDHLPQIAEQMTKSSFTAPLSQFKNIDPTPENFFLVEPDNFELSDYQHNAFIKGNVSK